MLQVGVHIADVSHFIRPGTAIDREAANRGTTVYLIDKVREGTSSLSTLSLCFSSYEMPVLMVI